jgi:Fur family ferric uptake transcriptional regulator
MLVFGKKDRSIDRSTVYRTLDVFAELGLIVSADTGIGEKVYEIAKPEPQHHLVCKKCGKEREIDNTVMQRLFGVIEEKYRFAINMDQYGPCNVVWSMPGVPKKHCGALPQT